VAKCKHYCAQLISPLLAGWQPFREAEINNKQVLETESKMWGERAKESTSWSQKLVRRL